MLELWPGGPKRSLRVIQERGSPVQMQASFAALCNRQILQDLRLKRGAQTLALLDAVVLGSELELGQRGDPQILVEPQNLFRSEARDSQEFEHAIRDVFAQFFEARMGAGLIQFRDDVGDRFADARDLREPLLRDELVQRLRESGQAVRRARIGFSPVGVATAQGGSLRVFPQKLGYGMGDRPSASRSLNFQPRRAPPRRVRSSLGSSGRSRTLRAPWSEASSSPR